MTVPIKTGNEISKADMKAVRNNGVSIQFENKQGDALILFYKLKEDKYFLVLNEEIVATRKTKGGAIHKTHNYCLDCNLTRV